MIVIIKINISFFKWCVKEAVVAAIFMLELNIFQIFGPRNDIPFCALIVLKSGISNVICNLLTDLRTGYHDVHPLSNFVKVRLYKSITQQSSR